MLWGLCNLSSLTRDWTLTIRQPGNLQSVLLLFVLLFFSHAFLQLNLCSHSSFRLEYPIPMDATHWLRWSPNATSFLKSFLTPFVGLSWRLSPCAFCFSSLLLIIGSSSRVHNCSFFVFSLLLCKWQVLCKYFLDYGIMSIEAPGWIGELRECIFWLGSGGLEGLYFFVKRALEVMFVGLGVSHVWNISNGKWGKKVCVHGDKGTIPCCNPHLRRGTGK